MNTDIRSFGERAERIKADAAALARDIHLARVYLKDTAASAGQADYDLLHGAQCMELAARDLRQTHARIEQMRADLSNPELIAAE